MSNELWWAIFLVANVPLYLVVGYAFFGSWYAFWYCVSYLFTPDVVSAARGEGPEDGWSHVKLVYYAGTCALLMYAEYRFLQDRAWFSP